MALLVTSLQNSCSEQSKEPTNSTHMTMSLRIEPQLYWLGVSALTTVQFIR